MRKWRSSQVSVISKRRVFLRTRIRVCQGGSQESPCCIVVRVAPAVDMVIATASRCWLVLSNMIRDLTTGAVETSREISAYSFIALSNEAR